MTDNLLDHPLIGGRYFFPLLGELEDPFWVDCGDARLACSYHQVDPVAKTLIHFHGNGEIVDDYLGPFVEQVLAAGCNLLLAEYRGYGRSIGRPQLGKMLEDVGAIVAALGRSPEELVFFGRSVGSLFAVEAVRRFPQAAGLVLESGVADVLERLLLRVTPEELGVSAAEFAACVRGSFDQQAKLATYPGPLLVLHTQNDGLVDLSHGQRLYDWGQGRKTLKVFERGNHNTILQANAPEYFAELRLFLAGLRSQ